MKTTIEQLLAAARPDDQAGNAAFVRKVVKATQEASGSETFEQALRTIGATKKERFGMKIKQLSKLTSRGLAAFGVVALTGTAFAAYRLWARPSATIRPWKDGGAVVRLSDCREGGDNNVMYFDKGADPVLAAGVLKANCEINSIQQWAMNTLHVSPSSILFPYTVTSIHGTTMQVANGADVRVLSTSKATKYIAGGVSTIQSGIHVGDVISYVASSSSSPVRAVIKLDQALLYYQTSEQDKVVALQACPGNTADLCQTGAAESVDIHPWGEGGANPNSPGAFKEIQGTLLSVGPSQFVLQSSSGAKFTIHMAEDYIAEFNMQYNKSYAGDPTITTGSTLIVRYRLPNGESNQNIAANEVNEISLLVIGNAKTGSLQAY